MQRRHSAMMRVMLGALALALWAGQHALQRSAEAQGVQAPIFEVDPFWPKPLPNNWRLGSTIGVWVDDRDHDLSHPG